jgi:hypothetical protein
MKINTHGLARFVRLALLPLLTGVAGAQCANVWVSEQSLPGTNGPIGA